MPVCKGKLTKLHATNILSLTRLNIHLYKCQCILYVEIPSSELPETSNPLILGTDLFVHRADGQAAYLPSHSNWRYADISVYLEVVCR